MTTTKTILTLDQVFAKFKNALKCGRHDLLDSDWTDWLGEYLDDKTLIEDGDKFIVNVPELWFTHSECH